MESALAAIMEYLPLAALILTGLFGVGVLLINRMAARSVIDGWDKAKEVTDKLAPIVDTIKAWADAKSPEVPPSPTNPSGSD